MTLESKLKESLLEILEDRDNGVYRVLEVVDTINCYDDSLDDLRYYENDEDFFNTFFYNNPMNSVLSSFYGNYRPMDEYVKFNVYGNLVSITVYELRLELIESAGEIVDRLIALMDKDIDIKEEVNILLEY